MTVHELLSRVSSKELAAWRIYEREEPFGYDMENWRSAMLACIFSSPYRKKGAKKPKIKDFLPRKRPQFESENDSGITGDAL